MSVMCRYNFDLLYNDCFCRGFLSGALKRYKYEESFDKYSHYLTNYLNLF